MKIKSHGDFNVQEITERMILESMEQESTWDTILEEFTMPIELYKQIKNAQVNWQNWLDVKAIELKIDPKKVKDCRGY